MSSLITPSRYWYRALTDVFINYSIKVLIQTINWFLYQLTHQGIDTEHQLMSWSINPSRYWYRAWTDVFINYSIKVLIQSINWCLYQLPHLGIDTEHQLMSWSITHQGIDSEHQLMSWSITPSRYWYRASTDVFINYPIKVLIQSINWCLHQLPH